MIRLNKFLSEAGFCSRREADRLALEGRITVNGAAAAPGMKIDENSVVRVDGRLVVPVARKVILAVNKPAGVVCTTDRRWNDRLLEDIIDYPDRVFPVGRLDKDSQGLILMTNQGELLNRIMKAGNYHEKEYQVRVDHPITQEFLEGMAQGVYLQELDKTTRPCRIWQSGNQSFHIVLTQGLNRQIRRMCSVFGYRVAALTRIRIMNIRLGDLPSGQYRELTREETDTLMNMLKESLNNTELKWEKKK